MKYTISINQLVLSKTKLDIVDASILDYLIIICYSKNSKIEKERKDGFTWINYSQLIREMPMIKIKSSGALTPRIRRIEDEGYIKTERKMHQKLYFILTEKVDELFTTVNRAIHENEQLPPKAIHNREHYNNTNDVNNYTNDPATRGVAKKEIDEVIDLFKDVNPSFERMFRNKTERGAAERLIKAHGMEWMRKVVSALKGICSQPYAPKIISPYQLERDMGKLKMFYEQTKKSNKVTLVRL